MANYDLKKEKNSFHLANIFNLTDTVTSLPQEKSRGEAATSNSNKDNTNGQFLKKTFKENKSINNNSISLKTNSLFKPMARHESLVSEFRLFLQPLSTNRDKLRVDTQHQQQQFEDFKSYYVKKMTDFGFSDFTKRDSRRMESFMSRSEPNLAAYSLSPKQSFEGDNATFKRTDYSFMDSEVVNEMYESMRRETLSKSRTNDMDRRKTSVDSNESMLTISSELSKISSKYGGDIEIGEKNDKETNETNDCRDLTYDYFRTKKKSKPHNKYFSPSLIICKY
jgi:hypothetical protein